MNLNLNKAIYNLDAIVGNHLNLTVFWSSEVDSLMLKKLTNVAKTFDVQKNIEYTEIQLYLDVEGICVFLE